MKSLPASAAGICAIFALFAVPARADTFSFASGSNADGPIFAGAPSIPPAIGSFTDGQHLNVDHMVMVDLVWDADEDGPAPAAVLPALFTFRAQLLSYTSIPVDGAFLHSYTATGFIDFVDPNTFERILRINYRNALFTSWSDSASLWGQTAALQGHLGVDPNLVFLPGPSLPGRILTESEDFAFDLTNIRTDDGARVPINANGGILDTWLSEGSFSAQAVPAPGTAALALLAGMVAARRRRHRGAFHEQNAHKE